MAYYVGTIDLGGIPLPGYITPQQFVDDAADEIDSWIGFIYDTPVDVTDNSDTARPARLLLKRINKHLATGRMILKLDSSGEEDRLHAYGASLVSESLAALKMITEGKVVLEGAVVTPVENNKPQLVVLNADPESNVEAFYDRIANPNVSFIDTGYVRRAGG